MAKRPLRPEDLYRLVFLADPQIRPDGQELLFQRKTIGERNDYRTQLVGLDLEGNILEWTSAEFGAAHGRWSPDGRRIAFLGKRGETKTQICLLEADGGEAHAITSLPEGDFAGFRWSPDGARIAFAFRERHPDWTEAAAKVRAESGGSTPPRVAENPLYRWDGEGYFLDRRHALYVFELATGAVKRLLKSCPWGRYSYDWSPDGKRLAVKRSFQENLWKDPEDDRILLVELDGRSRPLGGQPKGYKTSVRWSPDGKWIAYLGNADPLDHRGIANTELFVAPAEGGEPRRLTQKSDIDLETSTLSDMGESGGGYLEWKPDSSGLFVGVGWRGESQIGFVDLKSRFTVLSEGHHVVLPGGLSSDGTRMACLVTDPASPFEAAEFDLREKKLTRRSAFNAPLLKEVQVARPEELRLEAEDGYPVHAWVLRPKGGKGKCPGLLEIHGGPQAQYGWTFFFEFQLQVAEGFTVVYSNPRGSKGYGQAHVAAISGAWGQKDWMDIVAVKEWMKRQHDIDPKRLGIIGGSYGGYLVNWAVGHTDDFRAAVTDRCVSNLLSKSLTSDYPYYPGTYWKGSGYGSLESNTDLWRDSPLAFFDQALTPMLIIHSEGDLRCAIEQGEQVFSALQERGIPSRLIRYPASTSHGMSRIGPPDLRVHRLREISRWWRERL